MSLQWYRPIPMPTGIDYSELCAHRYMGWIHNRGSHPAQPTHPFVSRAVPNIHLSCHLDCPNFYFVPTHAIKMCHATVRAQQARAEGTHQSRGRCSLLVKVAGSPHRRRRGCLPQQSEINAANHRQSPGGLKRQVN